MKIARKFLIFLALAALICGVYASSIRRYVSVESFLSRHKNLSHRWDPLNLTFELRNRSRNVQLKVDSDFYIFNKLQITKKESPIYKNNKILIPMSWVGELEKKLLVNFRPSAETRNYKRIASRSLPSTNKKHKNVPPLKQKKNYPARRRSRSLNFIVIDPGHGGKDPGARGHRNVLEKHITLNFSRQLSKILKKKFPHVAIIMTRNRDHFISLKKRGKIANRYLKQNKFGIFLSLHFNATFSTRSNGFEIYYLDRNTGNNSERLDMIKRNLHTIKHKNAKKMISHMMDGQIQEESKVLAREIHRNFLAGITYMVRSRGIRRADFSVIRSVSMPALLIELGYLTNRNEAAMMQTKRFHRKAAQAIANGIRNFLYRRPRI